MTSSPEIPLLTLSQAAKTESSNVQHFQSKIPAFKVPRDYLRGMISLRQSPVTPHQPLATVMDTSQREDRNSQYDPVTLSRVDAAENVDSAYLTYAPGLTSDNNSPKSYSTYLTQLGFRSSPVATVLRDELIRDVRNHVDTSHYKYLRREDNESAFKTMVSEFLREHGTNYWGYSKRYHLLCQDARKGFLCPRDAQREGSRLIQVLESMFSYKAINVRKNDLFSTGLIVRHIDFSAMTGRAADASPLQALLEDVTSKLETRPPAPRRRKRIIVLSDSEDDFDTSEDSSIPDSTYPQPYLRPRARKSEGACLATRPTNTPPHSFTNHCSTKSVFSPGKTKRQKRIGRHFGDQARESIADSNQLIVPSHHRTYGFTPSTTENPSSAPSQLDLAVLSTRLKTPQVIDLTYSNKESIVKEEPISADSLQKTILLVSASNQLNRAEIAIELSACKDLEQLFSVLIEARNLSPEAAKKVNVISATYTWDKKRLGLRRGKVEDWVRFCRAIRKAWDSESVHFEEECEIEMMIHVDE